MQNLILVVDDDGFHRRTAERILKASGYQVGSLSSGEAMLAFMNAQKADLILLSLRMGGIGGFASLKKLRELPNGADVPVLAMIDKHNADDESKAVAAGAAGFVTTPFVPSVLLLTVRNTLGLSAKGVIKAPETELIHLTLKCFPIYLIFMSTDEQSPVSDMSQRYPVQQEMRIGVFQEK